MPISHWMSSIEPSSMVAASATPALLTMRLTFPCSATTWSAQANTAARSATSTRCEVTFTPLPSHRATVLASPVSLTSLRARCAPRRASSRASARPMPEPAPVMAATRPLKVSIETSCHRSMADCQGGSRNRSAATDPPRVRHGRLHAIPPRAAMAGQHVARLDVLEAIEGGHGQVAVRIGSARLQLRHVAPSECRVHGAQEIADEDDTVLGELQHAASGGVPRGVEDPRMAGHVQLLAVLHR